MKQIFNNWLNNNCFFILNNNSTNNNLFKIYIISQHIKKQDLSKIYNNFKIIIYILMINYFKPKDILPNIRLLKISNY